MTAHSLPEQALHLLQDRRYKQALKTARSGLKTGPRQGPSPMLQNICGIALCALGKPREAINEFTRALRKAPDFTEARRNLAQTLLLIGEAAKPRDHLTHLPPPPRMPKPPASLRKSRCRWAIPTPR